MAAFGHTAERAQPPAPSMADGAEATVPSPAQPDSNEDEDDSEGEGVDSSAEGTDELAYTFTLTKTTAEHALRRSLTVDEWHTFTNGFSARNVKNFTDYVHEQQRMQSMKDSGEQGNPPTELDDADIMHNMGFVSVKTMFSENIMCVDFDERVVMLLYNLNIKVGEAEVFMDGRKLHKWMPMKTAGITHNSIIHITTPLRGGGKTTVKPTKMKPVVKKSTKQNKKSEQKAVVHSTSGDDEDGGDENDSEDSDEDDVTEDTPPKQALAGKSSEMRRNIAKNITNLKASLSNEGDFFKKLMNELDTFQGFTASADNASIFIKFLERTPSHKLEMLVSMNQDSCRNMKYLSTRMCKHFFFEEVVAAAEELRDNISLAVSTLILICKYTYVTRYMKTGRKGHSRMLADVVNIIKCRAAAPSQQPASLLGRLFYT